MEVSSGDIIKVFVISYNHQLHISTQKTAPKEHHPPIFYVHSCFAVIFIDLSTCLVPNEKVEACKHNLSVFQFFQHLAWSQIGQQPRLFPRNEWVKIEQQSNYKNTYTST